VLQTLKFAWVQYVALLAPSLWIFTQIVGFALRHQIIEAAVSSDLATVKRI
jgi:hypothetical protein